MSGSRYYKPLLLLLALLLLIVAGVTQPRLNRSRAELGLTRNDPLENAPPVLAFTTVALGGFRGLIANALWIRAMELQDAGKYFEMVQLSDWITKLQPHFATIWVVQAWNMAYNISIKFQNPKDRWFWVRQGIRLLRDDGLRFNPKETLIYRELAWFFQHKMGQNLDDAHLFFKQYWAQEMAEVLGGGRPDYPALLSPTTVEASNRVERLRNEYKLDPARMQEVDAQYGPLDWRMPESHAIYWAWLGLAKAKREELITLRRVIYQSMQLAFQRGRYLESKLGRFDFAPNLDLIPNANRAYESMMDQDAEYRDHIKTGHRNFLRDAVYFLYVNNRVSEAAQWMRVLAEKYPDLPLLTANTNSLPGRISLDDYALDRVGEDAGETSMDRTKSLLQGMLTRALLERGAGFDDRATNLELLALKIWNRYTKEVEISADRVGLPPLERIRQDALNDLLAPDSPVDPRFKDQLRTALNLPADTNAPASLPPPANTNAPPPAKP